MLTDVRYISNQCIKSFCGGTNAKNYRHRTHFALNIILGVLVTFNKALHDGGVGACLTFALGATVRFVNDEIEVIRLTLDGVVQRLPNGILPIIGMLRQLTAATDLLGVQEIHMAILQHLHIERIFRDGYALTKAQLAGF